MGQTRVKKTKKASKQPEDASKPVSQDLEKLSLSNNSTTSSQLSQETPSTDSVHTPDPSTPRKPKLEADSSYIEILSTESKGVAVFAARKIPAGTLILTDTPLIRLTQHEEDADKSNQTTPNPSFTLDHQFNMLSKPTQKSYLALFDSQKSDFSKVKSIYYSNCYNLSGSNRPSKTSAGGSCIGLTASRINHSCVPNVQFSFDEAENKMLFHAIKPIPKGRELLSNYDSVFEVRAQRQKRLLMYYGFRCDCEACEPGLNEFWGRSDERRRTMIEAMREVRECEKRLEKENEGGKLGLGMDPMGVLEKLEGLLVKEALVGLPLADAYRSLGKWSDRLGDAKAARKWRAKELDVCVTCLGKGALRVQDLRKKLEQKR